MSETIKGESSELTLSSEITSLCKNAAYLLGGIESDVETLIKNAVNFYMRHQKDNTNPQLPEMEQTLIKQFDMLTANLQNILAQRDSALLNKLPALMLACGFEAELTQLMLRDQYCRDSKSTARYEQLRSFVISKLGSQFENNETTELLELRETGRLLQNQTTKYLEELQEIKKKKDELKLQLSSKDAEYTTLARQYTDVKNNLEAYTRLVQWYERLVEEVPKIRKKNSGLIKEQSWDGAVAEFIYYNPRPG